jgi:hypothetical protein
MSTFFFESSTFKTYGLIPTHVKPAVKTARKPPSLVPLPPTPTQLETRVCEEEIRTPEDAPSLSLKMPFCQAGFVWLDNYRIYIKPRTQTSYRQYIGTLASFFGDLPLAEILRIETPK